MPPTTPGSFLFLLMGRHCLERILPEPGLDALANNRGNFLRLLIDRSRRLDGGLIDDQAADRRK